MVEVEKKVGKKWHTVAAKAVTAALTASLAAAVDIGLLNGLFGQLVKALLQQANVV